MMNSLTAVEGVLQDVAIKLYYSLHSSENENIISSLLTAALNESEDFLQWFLCRSGMDKHCRSKNFYAEANVSLPEELRRDKNTKEEYKFPDVFVLYKDSYAKWEYLKNPNNKKNRGSSYKALRSIFIEVKHTNLEPRDSEKYTSFNRRIKNKCNKKWVRFVIISSHTKRGLEHLRKKEDKEWIELRKKRNIGDTQHIILSEIYDEIKKINTKDHNNNILNVFETYLSLILGINQDDNILIRLWKDIRNDAEGYTNISLRKKSIKKEIVEHIKWLSKINGISKGRWVEKSIEELNTINIDKSKNRASMERKGGSVDKLEVKFNSNKHFVFDIDSALSSEQGLTDISLNIKKISSLISSTN